MHRKPRMRAWRSILPLTAAVFLACASALGGTGDALAAPGGPSGPTLQGQVVDVAPGGGAIVVQLASGQWEAVNVTGQTVVVSTNAGGSGSGASGVATGDYVLVAYSVQHGGDGAGVWLVARWLEYSPSPISLGQSVQVSGTVASILSGGFTLNAGDGQEYVVTVMPGTVVHQGNRPSLLSFLEVGDNVRVWGTAVGNAIVATRIVYKVVNHPAQGRPRQRH